MRITLLVCLVGIMINACSQPQASLPPQKEVRAEGQQVGTVKDVVVDKKAEQDTIGVKGELMKAFIIAYQDFIKDKDIASNKRRIENYNIGLLDRADFYEITFVPISKEGQTPTIGGVTEQGQPIKYQIEKKNFSIREKLKFM